MSAGSSGKGKLFKWAIRGCRCERASYCSDRGLTRRMPGRMLRHPGPLEAIYRKHWVMMRPPKNGFAVPLGLIWSRPLSVIVG